MPVVLMQEELQLFPYFSALCARWVGVGSGGGGGGGGGAERERKSERNRCVTVNPFVVAKQPNWHPTVSHRRIFS